MPGAMGFDTQKELIAFALDETRVPGYYMEFGVFTGGTMRYMARQRPNMAFHGFDSFEGLRENWLGHYLSKGAFSLKGRLPNVPHNVTLHKGWFNETLPPWRAANPGKAAFMHIDCDLYSSTRFVLTQLKDRLRPGSTLLFDEIYTYPGWEKYEARAFVEFLNETGFGYDCIGQHGEDKAAFRLV